MLQYVCDWCNRRKKEGDRWILGFAAERVRAASEHREITIAAAWSEKWAGHPLAVHFCSPKHKQNYVCALLGTATVPLKPRRPDARRAASMSPDVSSALPASKVCEVAATPRSAKSSRNKSPSRKKTRLRFGASDRLRAHGLGVSLQ